MDAFDVGAVGAMGYVAQRLFGKTLDEIGSDISNHYKKRRDAIVNKAASKVLNPDDGKTANFRVARDVLWNGVATDGEVCAEYFGGILAASRSEDGSNDSCIHYVDVIKSLSSKQLHLHYCIYEAIQRQLIQGKKEIRPAEEDSIKCVSLYSSFYESLRRDLSIELDLPVLARAGLISAYMMNNENLSDGKVFPYFMVIPSTFGVALYAAALNKIDIWLKYSNKHFGVFDDVERLGIHGESLLEVIEKERKVSTK